MRKACTAAIEPTCSPHGPQARSSWCWDNCGCMSALHSRPTGSWHAHTAAMLNAGRLLQPTHVQSLVPPCQGWCNGNHTTLLSSLSLHTHTQPSSPLSPSKLTHSRRMIGTNISTLCMLDGRDIVAQQLLLYTVEPDVCSVVGQQWHYPVPGTLAVEVQCMCTARWRPCTFTLSQEHCAAG